MTEQQPEPADLGYCLQCGDYGRGKYVGTINSHSDTISDHVGCKKERGSAATPPPPRP